MRYDKRVYGPHQANLVLIAYASSEGSGEPAHPRSLARTSTAHSYKQWVKRNLQTENQIPAPLSGWACAVKICHDGMLEDTNSLDGLIWYNTKFVFSVNTLMIRAYLNTVKRLFLCKFCMHWNLICIPLPSVALKTTHSSDKILLFSQTLFNILLSKICVQHITFEIWTWLQYTQ